MTTTNRLMISIWAPNSDRCGSPNCTALPDPIRQYIHAAIGTSSQKTRHRRWRRFASRNRATSTVSPERTVSCLNT